VNISFVSLFLEILIDFGKYISDLYVADVIFSMFYRGDITSTGACFVSDEHIISNMFMKGDFFSSTLMMSTIF